MIHFGYTGGWVSQSHMSEEVRLRDSMGFIANIFGLRPLLIHAFSDVSGPHSSVLSAIQKSTYDSRAGLITIPGKERQPVDTWFRGSEFRKKLP